MSNFLDFPERQPQTNDTELDRRLVRTVTVAVGAIGLAVVVGIVVRHLFKGLGFFFGGVREFGYVGDSSHRACSKK